MNEKVIYSQKAPVKSNAAARVFLFAVLLVFFCLLLFVAANLPYSGIITLGVIFLFALCTYKLMKTTVFDITYVLCEDKLIFNRRYGKIEMETEVFPLNESEFKENAIIYCGKTYAFYPDDKMKEHLGIQS